MRHWLFHPLIFYPLAIILAALAITVSLRPQAWPREPVPVAAEIVDNALVYEFDAFNAPSPSPEQNMTVVRDFWGRPQSLRIAQLPRQPPPTPAEQGVRILMTPEDAARIEDKYVTIEVTYNSLPVNAAYGLWVSVQGIGPANWSLAQTPPDVRMVSYELPPQVAVNAIGLRPWQEGQDEAFGLEITRIRIIPHT